MDALRRSVVIVAATAGSLGLVGVMPAYASQGASVSTTPAAFTPYVTTANSEVTQIVQCGSAMYAVGSFAQIGVPGGTRYARSNAFSFNATTGAVSAWNPDVNGTVSAVVVSTDCTHVYLGGSFTAVGGTSVTNLAEVNATTGTVTTAFRPQPNNEVYSLALTSSQLIAGGLFTSIGTGSRTALASVSPTTGVITSYANLGVSGKIPGNDGATKVFKLRASPSGQRLLVLGNFSSVGGKTRLQAFIVDLGSTVATLDAWYAPDLSRACDAQTEPYYVRAGTWSPDGSRVYFATTGYKGVSALCDAASAFSSTSNSTQAPIWINKTGCDSLYSVAADSSTVYIGGHERYADNPHGCDAAGPGSVSRPGVGALSPSTGQALAWDPTRGRGKGADDELRTSAGLWIASDVIDGSPDCGGVYHPDICFFPNG